LCASQRLAWLHMHGKCPDLWAVIDAVAAQPVHSRRHYRVSQGTESFHKGSRQVAVSTTQLGPQGWWKVRQHSPTLSSIDAQGPNCSASVPTRAELGKVWEGRASFGVRANRGSAGVEAVVVVVFSLHSSNPYPLTASRDTSSWQKSPRSCGQQYMRDDW
jgi:hypothetical protein